MKILVNGIQSNLRFSSAHVIPGHESCGYIHGHSYFVDVEIEGERAGKFEFVVDFKDVKRYTKAICDELDHRLLIPVYNDLVEFKDFDKKKDSIFNLKKEKSIYFKIGEKVTQYLVKTVYCCHCLTLLLKSCPSFSLNLWLKSYLKLMTIWNILQFV